MPEQPATSRAAEQQNRGIREASGVEGRGGKAREGKARGGVERESRLLALAPRYSVRSSKDGALSFFSSAHTPSSSSSSGSSTGSSSRAPTTHARRRVAQQADRSSRQKLIPCCTLGLGVRRLLNERPQWSAARTGLFPFRVPSCGRFGCWVSIQPPPPLTGWAAAGWPYAARLRSNEPVKKSSRASEAGVRVLYILAGCPGFSAANSVAEEGFLAACSAPCGQTQGAEEEGGWGSEGGDFWNGTPGQDPRPTTLIHENNPVAEEGWKAGRVI
ncbi:hypothetical protein F5882DRAFT_375458 [Hyaloscypha sp. PMI_1271]|nr:hypothetical protein F5882DRAFT_375458 [Hyaloscypha sp. PMI_1271]